MIRATKFDQMVQRAYTQAEIEPAAQDPTLAMQIEVMVIELTDQLAGPDRQGEGYLQKIGRLSVAGHQATEIALEQLLPKRAAASPEELQSLDLDQVDENDLEALMDAPQPLTWPSDPEHPLNDPDRVEQMSPEQIDRLWQEFDQSPTQQRAYQVQALLRRNRHGSTETEPSS